MKALDMLKRLKAGEKAIDLSIEKWQDIIDGTGEDQKLDNCALCKTYLFDRRCDKCPLVLYSAAYECDICDSPYITGDAVIMRDALIETKKWMIKTGRYEAME